MAPVGNKNECTGLSGRHAGYPVPTRALFFGFTERTSLKAEHGELPLSKRQPEIWDLRPSISVSSLIEFKFAKGFANIHKTIHMDSLLNHPVVIKTDQSVLITTVMMGFEFVHLPNNETNYKVEDLLSCFLLSWRVSKQPVVTALEVQNFLCTNWSYWNVLTVYPKLNVSYCSVPLGTIVVQN